MVLARMTLNEMPLFLAHSSFGEYISATILPRLIQQNRNGSSNMNAQKALRHIGVSPGLRGGAPTDRVQGNPSSGSNVGVLARADVDLKQLVNRSELQDEMVSNSGSGRVLSRSLVGLQGPWSNDGHLSPQRQDDKNWKAPFRSRDPTEAGLQGLDRQSLDPTKVGMQGLDFHANELNKFHTRSGTAPDSRTQSGVQGLGIQGLGRHINKPSKKDTSSGSALVEKAHPTDTSLEGIGESAKQHELLCADEKSRIEKLLFGGLDWRKTAGSVSRDPPEWCDLNAFADFPADVAWEGGHLGKGHERARVKVTLNDLAVNTISCHSMCDRLFLYG